LALSYPPFSHLIRIVCAAIRPEPAYAAASALRARLLVSESAPQSSVRTGPAVLGPAALFRLRGRERQMLVLKAGERRRTVKAVGEAVAGVAAERMHRGVSFSVDVDPQ
jgi:primosomal protein N' (replication factor Y)